MMAIMKRLNQWMDEVEADLAKMQKDFEKHAEELDDILLNRTNVRER